MAFSLGVILTCLFFSSIVAQGGYGQGGGYGAGGGGGYGQGGGGGYDDRGGYGGENE
jgi:hypothetical protein